MCVRTINVSGWYPVSVLWCDGEAVFGIYDILIYVGNSFSGDWFINLRQYSGNVFD